MSNKKAIQLGMNPSTAQGRLVKDILWKLVVQTQQDNCCKCGEQMTRDTFSIEHVKPWLDSEDPVGLFFDTDNISFSHLRCNVVDALRNRERKKQPCGTKASFKRGCKCDKCTEANRAYERSLYTPEKRTQRYRRTGN